METLKEYYTNIRADPDDHLEDNDLVVDNVSLSSGDVEEIRDNDLWRHSYDTERSGGLWYQMVTYTEEKSYFKGRRIASKPSLQHMSKDYRDDLCRYNKVEFTTITLSLVDIFVYLCDKHDIECPEFKDCDIGSFYNLYKQICKQTGCLNYKTEPYIYKMVEWVLAESGDIQDFRYKCGKIHHAIVRDIVKNDKDLSSKFEALTEEAFQAFEKLPYKGLRYDILTEWERKFMDKIMEYVDKKYLNCYLKGGLMFRIPYEDYNYENNALLKHINERNNTNYQSLPEFTKDVCGIAFKVLS